MILDNKVKIKITRRNIDYFKQFYEKINLKDIIEIDTSQLQKNSNIKINVECDLCDIKRFIKYQAYSKNINSCLKYPIYTCDKCSHVKLKDYNKTHYGVDYYSQHPDRNDKIKKTCIDRYGVDHFSKTDSFKDKFNKTCLERYGVENPFMDTEMIKRSFNDKYGVDYPSQVKEIRDKMKKSTKESIGYECSFSSPEIRDRIDETNKKKYGGHPMISEEIRSINTFIARDKDYISYCGDYTSIFKCDKGHNFKISSDLYHNRVRSNLPLCTICYPISENRSIKEIELLKYIQSVYNSEIVTSYRDGLEIDIYLPELKIGFEFNGLYWHSSHQKQKNYHSNKTKYFSERHIRIVHIWEDDWDYKKDIIKSQIMNWVGKSEIRIYARKCEVREVTDKKQVRIFLNNNHIQGHTNSIKKIGLFYNGELVSLMAFDKSEGRKKMVDGEWNLNRFCNKINTSVVGGSSKLIKYFIKSESPSRIISYADKDWSVGSVYNTLGFSKISESGPDYKYIIGDKRAHKSKFRKSKLNTELSESNFMKLNGVSRIYDCGKIKFEMMPNSTY